MIDDEIILIDEISSLDTFDCSQLFYGRVGISFASL